MAVPVFVLGLGGVRRQIDNKDITPSKQIPFQILLFFVIYFVSFSGIRLCVSIC